MLKSLGSNWARVAVTIVVSFVLTPFLTRSLGVTLFGSWAVINAYVGWLALLQIGIPMASVRLFAQAVAKGDLSGLNRAASTSLAISLVIGLIAALAGCLLFLVYDSLNVAKVTANHLGDARLAFFLAVLQLTVGFACQVPYGIMAAHQDFPTSNLISITAILTRLVAMVSVFTFLPPSLTMVALVNLGVSLTEGTLGGITVFRRYPSLRIDLCVDRAVAKALFGFSIYVLLLNLGNNLSFATDSIVISSMINDASVTIFENGKMFVIYLTEFIIAIGAVIMPHVVRLETLGHQDEIRHLLRKWLKVAVSLSLLPGLYLVVLGGSFIGRWIDAPGFDASAAGVVLAVLMIAHFVFLPARGIALPILMGLGRPAAATIAFVGASVVNLALSVALARPLGLLGVALGTAIPEVIFALYVIRTCCKETGASLAEVSLHALERTVPGAFFPFALLLALSKFLAPSSWVALVGSGIAYVALFGVVWVYFVYRGDPDFDLHGRLRLLLVRRSVG